MGLHLGKVAEGIPVGKAVEGDRAHCWFCSRKGFMYPRLASNLVLAAPQGRFSK